MPTIIVLFKTDEKATKEKLDRELNWYDIIKQEMLILRGGKLVFEYKEDDYLIKMGEEERKRRGINSTYRLLPKVEDIEVVNYNNINKTNNKREIEKWFSSYLNYNDSGIIFESSDNIGIEFNVPKKEVDDFSYQLERNGFGYRT